MNFADTYVSVSPAVSDLFKVKVVGLEDAVTNAGNQRMRMTLCVLEGAKTGAEFENFTIKTGLNRANSGDAKRDKMMTDFWAKCLMSLGFEVSDLREHGDFQWDNITTEGTFESLKDRTGYLKFIPADPENGKQWSKDYWILEKEYNAMASARAELTSAATDDGSDPLSKMLNG